MAEEKTEKIILEREYIVPLRRKWLKSPEYKRVPKAVKSLKEFIARHMKVPERDLRKVKLDKWLNNEMWFRGIRKPAGKIKVKAKKFEDGEVYVELVEIPEKIKWKIEKEKKSREEVKKEKKIEEKPEEELEKKVEEETGKAKEEVKTEKKTEEKEKEKATIEAGAKQADEKHREIKHEAKMQKIKKQPLKRMALQK